MEVIRKYSGSNSVTGTSTPVLNENDFASNSDTSPASQKSTDFRIDSKTSTRFRQHFQNEIPNSPTTRKSCGVEAINPVQTGDPLSVSGLISTAIVTAGDGFIYMLTTNGNVLLKFDPQSDKIIESIPVSHSLGGNFGRGFYKKENHKIYFYNRSLDILIYDILSKEFSIINSTFSLTDINCVWINRDSSIIYGIRFINSNVVYKYNIESNTYSSASDTNLTVSSNRASSFAGLGKDNKAYIMTTPTSASSPATVIVHRFDCNTGFFESINIVLSRRAPFTRPVFSSDRRFIFLLNTDTRFTQGGIIKIDTENFTEVNFIPRSTIGYGSGFPSNFYSGFLGLDGSIIWIPSILQGDDFVCIQDDGSDLTETFIASTVGITTRKGFVNTAYGFNNSVYTGLIGNSMYKFTFSELKYSAKKIIHTSDSLTN